MGLDNMENSIGMNTTRAKDKCHELAAQLGRGGVQLDFRGTILIADDEAIVRMVLEEMLVRLGFEVHTAEDGRQALELFNENPDRFDLVIFDMAMPQMAGDELFYELRQIKPNVRAVLSSGYQEGNPADEMRTAGLSGFLPKPYNIIEIASELSRIFNLAQG